MSLDMDTALTPQGSRGPLDRDGRADVKMTRGRTRVGEWGGPPVPMQAHFCTNPMDLVAEAADSMTPFCFHGWLLVELFTDAGHVGIGEAGLEPPVTQSDIDTH